MSEHIFATIAAVAKNGAIGKANGLVWDNKDDLAHFKNITNGSAVIMGMNTYKSLPVPILPNRLNIVLTQNVNDSSLPVSNLLAFTDYLPFAIEAAENFAQANNRAESFFIGGGYVYKQAFDYVTRLYLTEVNETFNDADVFFPDWDKTLWNETSREIHDGYDFVVYDKKVF